MLAAATFAILGPLRAATDSFSVVFGIPTPSLLNFGIIPGILMSIAFLSTFQSYRDATLRPLFAVLAAAAVALSTIAYNELYSRLPPDLNAATHLDFNLYPIGLTALYFVAGAMSSRWQLVATTAMICWLALTTVVVGSALQAGTYQFTTLNPADDGIYLFVGDTLAITALLGLPLAKSTAAKTLFALAGAVVLAISLSRTAFFIYCLAVLVPLWPAQIRHRVGLIGVVAILTATYFLMFDFDGSMLSGLRVFQSFFGDALDNSLTLRNVLLSARMLAIIENPVFGDYWGQVTSLGYGGMYIHNILSWWEQFGVLAFLLVSYSLILCAGQVRAVASRLAGHPWGRCVIAAFIYSAVCMIFSRSFTSSHLWFPVGVISTAVFWTTFYAGQRAPDIRGGTRGRR